MKCHLMHQFEKWIGSLSKGSFRLLRNSVRACRQKTDRAVVELF